MNTTTTLAQTLTGQILKATLIDGMVVMLLEDGSILQVTDGRVETFADEAAWELGNDDGDNGITVEVGD
jgi:hypothetical protein